MKLLASRVRWIFQRARRFSPSRMLPYARQAQQLTPRTPLFFVVIDMFWCILRYSVAFENYAQWDYRILSGRERRTFMTEPKSVMISKVYNSAEHWETFDNKLLFAEAFADEIGREWLDLSKAGPEEFESFVRSHGRALAKEPSGIGGSGIVDIRVDDVDDFAALHRELVRDGAVLVEQFLEQHPEMSRMYPGSVNTLRIVTFLRPDGEVRVLARVLKMGAGSFVDNYGHGGMYTMLDERGAARHAAMNGKGEIFHKHPISGVDIEGFQVPLFDEVLEFVDRLARRIPEMPYVGWDIAITPDAPVVIEGNQNTGVFQSRPVITGVHEGLLSVYREAIGF